MKEKVVNLRYKYYNNTWNEFKIGSITDSFSGGTPNSSNKNYYSGEIPFIRSGEIKFTVTELFISREALESSSAKLVNKGDILYALYGATSGEVAISKMDGAINQAILALRPKEGFDSKFLESYLVKEKQNILDKYLQGGQGNLSGSIIKNISLSIPDYTEQQSVGSLFHVLDDLLLSYKENLANYQAYKATMLSKMFPKEGEKEPEIRLDGFNMVWEKVKLGSVTDRVKGNDGRMNLPTLTISAASGWMDQKDRFSQNIAGNEQKNYTLLKKGQLSYNHGNSKLAKFGVVFSLESYEEALVPRVYHSFKTNEKSDSIFLETMFSTKRTDRELSKLVSSGARMDGLLNINYDDFMGINITIPRIDEQVAIAQFFSNLDEIIFSYQDKILELENLKKRLLKEMFI